MLAILVTIEPSPKIFVFLYFYYIHEMSTFLYSNNISPYRYSQLQKNNFHPYTNCEIKGCRLLLRGYPKSYIK